MELSKIRRRDANRVRELLIPGGGRGPRSLVIQGFPSCGLKRLFADSTDWLRTEWASEERRILVEMNLSNFWPMPVAHLLGQTRKDIRSVLYGEPGATDCDLETGLVGLRGDIGVFAKSGGQTIFVLDNFDALIKFSEPGQVQALLNTFQSLGYQQHYQTAFVVSCCRDIEDTCQKSNYSDFYKVFGTNHYQVSRASEQEVGTLILENHAQINGDLLRTVVTLSAGYPEHAELLLRFGSSQEDMRRQAMVALAPVFEDWIASLTMDELQVIQLIADRRTLGYEHFFARNKLLRKQILSDVNGTLRITSPLFESHLIDRVGNTANHTEPFVRRSALMGDIHVSLVKQLFQGKHYLDWQVLQSPRFGDATVYLLSGEDEHGVSYRPSIVKIHRSEIIDQEINKTIRARERLGPVVPTVLAEATFKGQKAVLFEYATADNHNYEVHQFAHFYRNQSTGEVVSVIQKLFDKILWPFYQQQSLRNLSASRLYYLPRIGSGEFDQLDELLHRSTFYDPATDAVVLPDMAQRLANPAVILRPIDDDTKCLYYRLFLEKREAGICLVHGDINPRNVLVDGIGNVHLIDFAAMKEDGGRYLDFARLEAEIKFKLTEISNSADSILSVIRFDCKIGDGFDITSTAPTPNVDTEQFIKMAAAASAIRHAARYTSQNAIDDLAFELDTRQLYSVKLCA